MIADHSQPLQQQMQHEEEEKKKKKNTETYRHGFLPITDCSANQLSVPINRQNRWIGRPLLAFATQHSTINISLWSLQKTTLFQSQSSDYTVHNKFAFMNYTDGEHSGIKRAIQKRTGQSALHIAWFRLLHTDWSALMVISVTAV